MTTSLIKDERYNLWVPDREEKLEEMVKEHEKEIFGEDSEYFDIKTKIESMAGVGSIPDGYLITLDREPSWSIVEVELSAHDLDDHIGKQILRFVRGIKNLESRRKIVDQIYKEIKNDPARNDRFKEKVGHTEIHQFLSELFSRDPSLLIVIEEKTDELKEICEILPLETIALEFKTFVKEGADVKEHLHVLEPLSQVISPIPSEQIIETRDAIEATIGGKRVKISKNQILKASEDPRIENFGYRDWYVEIKGKPYPAKGLISLATGIPTIEFGSAHVRPLLKRLGFQIKKVTG